MGFDIIPTDIFKKEAKRLIKKFPSLKEELIELDRLLTDNPILRQAQYRNPESILAIILLRSGLESRAKERGKKEEDELLPMFSTKIKKSISYTYLINLKKILLTIRL